MKHLIYASIATIALIASQAFAGVSTDSVKLLLESQSFSDFLTVNDIATGSAAKVADALNALTGAKGDAIQGAIAKMVTQIGSNTSANNINSVVQANLVVNGHVAAFSELKSASLTASAANITGPKIAAPAATTTCSEAGSLATVESKLPADLASQFVAAINKERAARGQISFSEGDCGSGLSTYSPTALANYAKIYIEAAGLGSVTKTTLQKAVQDKLGVSEADAASEVDQFVNACGIFKPQAG